ncbi:MAG: hypothetical protein K2N60_05930, partial [Oscillospiraceae bacterium]|nr:hypothetical protein [Oscillospiraceae bacterium]
VNKEMIVQQVNGVIRKRVNQSKSREWTEIRTFQKQMRSNPDSYRKPREYKAEIGIISYLAANPEDADYIASKIAPEQFATDLNKKIYAVMLEKIKNSEFSDILSLQSEFTADEMGKITEIEVNRKDVNINKTAIDDFINILIHSADNPADAKDMSDDEFIKFTQNLKSKK